MNRRTFCRNLASLSLLAFLPRTAAAAVPASPQQVESVHQSLDRLIAQFKSLYFPPFSANLDEHLVQIPPMPELLAQSEWIDSALPTVSSMPSEFPAECCARMEAFATDLEFLREWNQLSQTYRKNPEGISPSRGYETMTPAEREGIQKLLEDGASCVYLTRERWKGLVCLEQGERWHNLFARYQTALPGAQGHLSTTYAEERLAFLDQEITRLQSDHKIPDLRAFLESPNNTITDDRSMLSELQSLDQKVRRLGLISESCPPVRFARMSAQNPMDVPGFYVDGTLYYYLEHPFLKQNLVWLYLHEVIPGHHAKISLQADSRERLLRYPGLQAGWSAYAERLGDEHGLFGDPVPRLGWLLWDQVRTGKVYLDWKVHRDGWTRGQGMEWWKTRLPYHQDRGLIEVRQVVERPGEALKYKAGELQLMHLRQQYRLRMGTAFRERDFHDRVLSQAATSWSELFHSL